MIPPSHPDSEPPLRFSQREGREREGRLLPEGATGIRKSGTGARGQRDPHLRMVPRSPSCPPVHFGRVEAHRPHWRGHVSE